jgi:hypothetical protein
MNADNFDAFLVLAETLTAMGWVIVKFENHDPGVTLTIVPVQRKKEAE